MQRAPAPSRGLTAYRTRVVAFTVGLVLLVSAAFMGLHRAVTGQLFRTGLDEPWELLVRSLTSDPFVLAGLVAVPATGGALEQRFGPRRLDPDPRTLAWLVVGTAPAAQGEDLVLLDRYVGDDGAEPQAEALAALVVQLQAEGAEPALPVTRVEGGVAIRADWLRTTRPRAPPPLAGREEAALRAVRPLLDRLADDVLPLLEDEVAGAPDERPRLALEAVLDLYAALSSLFERVLVPAALVAVAGGTHAERGTAPPEPLGVLGGWVETLVVTEGELTPAVDPAQVDGWIAVLSGWERQTRFEAGPRGLLAAAFASPQLELFTQLGRRFLAVSFALVVGGGLLGVAIARRTTEPLGRISSGIERFSRGDLAHRIVLERHDELAELARALNAMAEQLAEGERARRVASMGLVVGGAAHELKNPVHALKSELGLVDRYVRELAAGPAADRERELTERLGRLLDGARENVARMGQILEEITVVHRAGIEPRGAVDLVAASRAAVERLRPRWEGVLRVDVEAPEAALVEGAASLVRVPENLVTNAIAAVEEARAAGKPAGRVRVRIATAGNGLVLTVDDDGEGVAEDVRGRVFDLFFTTREVGRGTGLGLYLVHEIVAAHGGSVRCTSPGPLGGATFEVRLPLGTASPG